MKTEYRSVGDGYCRWLEYKTTYKILWFTISFWERVPSDHWDEWMHEGISCMDHNRFVNSYDFDLSKFVAKYPNIDQWMIKRNSTINEKRNRIESRKRNRINRNSGISQL